VFVVVVGFVVMGIVSLVACNFFNAICWIALKYVLLAAGYLQILQMGRGSVAPITFQMLGLSTDKGGHQLGGEGIDRVERRQRSTVALITTSRQSQ